MERNRIDWIDWLRVIACFMVVLSHACDPFVGQFDANPTAFITGTAIGSLVRPCVPLFAMMTGVLLLRPVATPLAPFYRKRLGRLVLPLAVWSLLLPVIGYCYFNFVNPLTANVMLGSGMYDTEHFIPRVWSWLFNFNYDTTALWYLYMLLGLYLIIPVLNSWLATASKKDLQLILAIWIGTLCVPYLQMAAPALGYEGNYGNYGLFGVCDWNVFGSVYYVSGFAGYLLLAYYLKTYPVQWRAGVMLPMFLLGYAITFGGYVLMQKAHPGNYAYLEIIWLFCGINVFMMTLPVFVTVQALNPRGNVSALAALTFGIYLVHFPFESMAYDLFDIPALPDWLRIILAAVTVFAVVAAIVWTLKQSKLTRRLVD